MKKCALATVSVFLIMSGSQAFAGDRYSTMSPVMVDSKLTGAWTNQLRVMPKSAGYGTVQPVRQFQNVVTQSVQPIRRIYSATPQNSQTQPMMARSAQVPMMMQQQQQIMPRSHSIFQSNPVQYGMPTNQYPVQQQYGQQTQQVAMMAPQNPSITPLDPQFLPQEVEYQTKEKRGTLVIDTNNRFLYLVTGNGMARRYGVGVGKPGFEWAGVHHITRKAEWPGWTPPPEMISREAAKGHFLPAHMEGGLENPLGSRAMYIGNTNYRIHGTNAPWTIGYAVSSGCIRMRNQDVEDLYERVPVGTKVIVQ